MQIHNWGRIMSNLHQQFLLSCLPLQLSPAQSSRLVSEAWWINIREVLLQTASEFSSRDWWLPARQQQQQTARKEKEAAAAAASLLPYAYRYRSSSVVKKTLFGKRTGDSNEDRIRPYHQDQSWSFFFFLLKETPVGTLNSCTTLGLGLGLAY